MCITTPICFVYQTIMLVFLRYLQTSVALAIEKGDPTADSLGYLLPICLPTDDVTKDDTEMVPLVARRAPSPSLSSASASSSRTFTIAHRASTPPWNIPALKQAAAVVNVDQNDVSESSVSADEGGGADGVHTALCDHVLTPTHNRASVNGQGRIKPKPKFGMMELTDPIFFWDFKIDKGVVRYVP